MPHSNFFGSGRRAPDELDVRDVVVVVDGSTVEVLVEDASVVGGVVWIRSGQHIFRGAKLH